MTDGVETPIPPEVAQACGVLRKQLADGVVVRLVIDGVLFVAARDPAAKDINDLITERTGSPLTVYKMKGDTIQ